MAMLTKDMILNAEDLPQELVEVPEWGGAVFVRSLTGTERDCFELRMQRDREATMQNARARLCALCMVDEKGTRLFEESEVESLGKKAALALDRVFTVALRLNGLSRKEVEELAKNSGRTSDGGSTTA